jgi:TonB-linked SusC/RagA family outer membrane protein
MRSWCTITSVRDVGRSLHARAWRRALFATLTLLASVVFSSPASAQSGTVGGVVVAAGTQEPIAGARVDVVGTTLRTQTDEKGQFRIAGVSGTIVTVEVRRIGYKLARTSARVGAVDNRIVLTLNPTSLEAVVVTGTPGAAQKRELGNAVGQINAADVVANAPVISMQGLLNGRSPSVVVMPTSGQIGSGSQIRIRGQASLSLGNNPLLYVDGVRVNNAAATGPVSQAFGSSPISRINDFNPEDIESIEILKGPSAATLYGTEAANGVINIITKKGSASAAPRWSFTARQGVNYFADWKTRFPVNYGPRRLRSDTTPAGLLANPSGPVEALNFDSLLVGACGDSIATRIGKKCDYFRNGQHQETELSVSGGAGLLNYYASGNLLDAQGAEPRSNRRTYSGRLNVGFAPTTRLNIGTNIGYVTGPTNVPCDAGCGGYTWTTLSATPSNYNLANRHGFHSSLPYQYDQTVVLWQDLARTTASVRIEHQPRTWLSQRLVLGGDITREGNNEYDPRIDSLQSQGYREITERDIVDRSLDYNASAIWNYNPTMRFTTSLGAQYVTESIHSVFANGSVFPSPGLRSVSATTTNKTNSEGFSDDKSLGIYGQEQFGWRDRLFVTGALRSDDHSAFGTQFNRVLYPKFSLSYVLSDEPWFSVPLVGDQLNEFRLRLAYGHSGKAPTTYSSIRTYTTTSGPNDGPAVTPNSLGNPDLGPEKSKELEVGFDASSLQDRLGLEFTYYNKKTVDAILNRTLAPSSGQANFQPINVGGIINSGIELLVRGTPWRSERFGLDLTGQFSTNHSEVTDIGLPGQYFVDLGGFLRHQVGYPAFAWFDQRVIATPFSRTTGMPAALPNQDYPIGVMCADTLPNSNGKEGGLPRSCVGNDGKWGTSDDAPNVYLGRSVPPREVAFSGTLTLFSRFRVFSMLDVKNGHKKMDGNTRVRCGIFGRCKENFLATFASEVDSIRAAQAASNSNLVDFLITKSNYARWRELSVSYDVPNKYARMARADRATIQVSGRNLALWTSYQGFEPEAMFLGGSRGGNAAWEQTTLPQLRTWMVTLNFGF